MGDTLQDTLVEKFLMGVLDRLMYRGTKWRRLTVQIIYDAYIHPEAVTLTAVRKIIGVR